MRYHSKDLLTLLISLFVLGGCKNPSGIGLDVQPGDEIAFDVIDSLTLHAVTLQDDSARSGAFNQTTFGLLDDPVIGKTSVDLALAIGKPAVIPRIRDDAEIDSVVLVLPYGSDFFGDSTSSSFTLQVRQLDEVFVEGAHSNKQWSVKGTVLGTRTLQRFAYKDSLTIYKHIEEKDSLIRVEPQLRLALSTDFFKDLLNESVDSASISTAAGFNNHVKGLYLNVDESTSSGIGSLATFKGVGEVTGIELVYRQPNGKDGDDAAIDTVRTFLPTTVAGTGGSLGLASSITRVYTPAVQEQLENPEGDFETIYLQAPAGLRARLSLPHIDSLKKEGLAINKAELVLYVDQEASGDNFGYYAPRLTLYREDIAGQRQPLPDGDTRSDGQRFSGDPRSLWYRYGGFWQAFGGEYQQEEQRYIFQITSFVQDLLLDRLKSNAFFIAPASVSDERIPYHSVLNTGSRAVIAGGQHPTYKMKLNIYYTSSN